MKNNQNVTKEDYEKLIDLIQEIGSFLEIKKILNRIISGAVNLINADQGTILLFDPAHVQEERTLIRKESEGSKLLDHYLNLLLSGWTRRHKKPLLTNNLVKTFGSGKVKKLYQDISSVLSIPLKLHDEVLGVFNLISLDKHHRFGERELQLIEILAKSCVQFILNARLHEELFTETVRLHKEVKEKYDFQGIIGQSPKMKQVFSLLERVIPTEGRVLLEGESGTGKELIARVLHYCGPRKDGPFVAVDCGALPASLLESELFGYAKGAFTGAHQNKTGLFEEAHNGTLFLDEIANMSIEVQSKFLRSIEEGEFRPLGTTQVKKVNVRIIAAASDNLLVQVDAGKFRQDLFYRLNVVNITLPSLRERREDIAILAHHFLNKMKDKHKKKIKGFHPETIIYLENYQWPGNVRELENIMERIVILAEDNVDYILPDRLPQEIRSQDFYNNISLKLKVSSKDIKTKKDAFEKKILLEALSENNWNQSATARKLGIRESTLRYKIRKFEIKKQ